LSESVVIRAATPSDVPALLPLARALVLQHVAFDRERYQPPTDLAAAYTELFGEHIGRAESVVVIAERAGEVLGYVFGEIVAPSLVEISGRTGWIHDLFVTPSARGLGVGGSLLDHAIDRLRTLGCPGGVMLGVAAQNTAAAALFRARGFRPGLQEMTLGP